MLALNICNLNIGIDSGLGGKCTFVGDVVYFVIEYTRGTRVLRTGGKISLFGDSDVRSLLQI